MRYLIIMFMLISCIELEKHTEDKTDYERLYDSYAIMKIQRNTMESRYVTTQNNYKFLLTRYEQLEKIYGESRKELRQLYIAHRSLREKYSDSHTKLKIQYEKTIKEKNNIEIEKSALNDKFQKMNSEVIILKDRYDTLKIKFIALETYNEQIQKRENNERNDSSIRGQVPQSE